MDSSIGILPEWLDEIFFDDGLSISGDELLARLKDRIFPHGENTIFLGLEKECNFLNCDVLETLDKLGVEVNEISNLVKVVLLNVVRDKIAFVVFGKREDLIGHYKKESIDKALKKCELERFFITVFANRIEYSKVADQIAWGTKVWIANEPHHMIHYDDKPVIRAR